MCPLEYDNGESGKDANFKRKGYFVVEPYNKKVVTERRTTSICGWVEVVEEAPQS
jgi:hypothetical protein